MWLVPVKKMYSLEKEKNVHNPRNACAADKINCRKKINLSKTFTKKLFPWKHFNCE